MKTTRLLRILSLLGFMLLIAPFFNACEDSYGGTKYITNAQGIRIKEPFYLKAYDFFVDSSSDNGFELAYILPSVIHEKTFKEFKAGFSETFKEKDWNIIFGLLILIFIDFIVLISFVMFIISPSLVLVCDEYLLTFVN